jgi:hypothetical protein
MAAVTLAVDVVLPAFAILLLAVLPVGLRWMIWLPAMLFRRARTPQN